MEKNNNVQPNRVKEMSLEELDHLCRKCHHLHDEEVLRIAARFFRRLANFFDASEQQPHHSSAH